MGNRARGKGDSRRQSRTPKKKSSRNPRRRGVHSPCCQAGEACFAEWMKRLGNTVNEQRLRRATIVALGSLSNARAAAAVQLVYCSIEPLTPAEAAAVTGLSEAQVDNALRRVRELVTSALRMERRLRVTS